MLLKSYFKKFLVSFLILLIGVFVINSYIRNDFVIKAQGINDNDWTQLQSNSQHIGRSTDSVAPNFDVAWGWFDKTHIKTNFVSQANASITDSFGAGFKFSTAFAAQVQPIIAESKTFFGSMDGVMYAVDSLTGSNSWDFTADDAIVSTAAYYKNATYGAGILVFTSLDGNVYGINASNGNKVWSYTTGAGISAAPVIFGSTVYVGSRDGKFYAINAVNGNLIWSYTTRVYPVNANSPFNSAPIIVPAGLSEDGSVVMFGAENMFFYGLNTSDGSEKWNPVQLRGQSFANTYPVIKGDKVVIYTMSSVYGAEEGSTGMEAVLAGLSSQPTWSTEKAAVSNFLTNNPEQKIMYVFNISTGTEPYEVAMGRVTGNNYPPYQPVVDNSDRMLTYWRSRSAYFLSDGATFGTQYCPDFSQLDLTNGDRVKLSGSVSTNGFCPELDNGFQPTIGGSYVYFNNNFRGLVAENLSTRAVTRIATTFAYFDGGDFRNWPYQIIFYGNDSQHDVDIRPEQAYTSTTGFHGAAIAKTNGTTMLYINSIEAGGIIAIKHKTS